MKRQVAQAAESSIDKMELQILAPNALEVASTAKQIALIKVYFSVYSSKN